jgi:hypothetical protein
MLLLALLMAQGVIAEDAPVETREGPRINDRKRTGEDHDALPGPSKRRAGSTIKIEDMSATARAERIRELQVSGEANGFSVRRF